MTDAPPIPQARYGQTTTPVSENEKVKITKQSESPQKTVPATRRRLSSLVGGVMNENPPNAISRDATKSDNGRKTVTGFFATSDSPTFAKRRRTTTIETKMRDAATATQEAGVPVAPARCRGRPRKSMTGKAAAASKSRRSIASSIQPGMADQTIPSPLDVLGPIHNNAGSQVLHNTRLVQEPTIIANASVNPNNTNQNHGVDDEFRPNRRNKTKDDPWYTPKGVEWELQADFAESMKKEWTTPTLCKDSFVTYAEDGVWKQAMKQPVGYLRPVSAMKQSHFDVEEVVFATRYIVV
jgi:hypothetical protein